MDSPLLTRTQSAAYEALVGVGFAGMLYGAVADAHSGRLRGFVFFLGLACVTCGVIGLTAKSSHVFLATLSVAFALSGALAGHIVWDQLHPNSPVPGGKGEPGESMRAGIQAYEFWGLMVGAPLVPLATTLIAWRRSVSRAGHSAPG